MKVGLESGSTVDLNHRQGQIFQLLANDPNNRMDKFELINYAKKEVNPPMSDQEVAAVLFYLGAKDLIELIWEGLSESRRLTHIRYKQGEVVNE